MKTLRNLLAVLMLFSVAIFSQSAVSLAHEDEHDKADLQMLRDAATALKASNPDLSEKLSKYADQEEKEGKEDADEDEEK